MNVNKKQYTERISFSQTIQQQTMRVFLVLKFLRDEIDTFCYNSWVGWEVGLNGRKVTSVMQN